MSLEQHIISVSVQIEELGQEAADLKNQLASAYRETAGPTRATARDPETQALVDGLTLRQDDNRERLARAKEVVGRLMEEVDVEARAEGEGGGVYEEEKKG
ncbi:hypothetical protein LTR17_006634 [Elasticomyces elasticus]|nr:hypothetical protein LTR17_006634 [Elasticomyces elasticus]